MDLLTTIIQAFTSEFALVGNNASQFIQTLQAGISIISLIDVVLVFWILWWLYRKLRRSDLIKILPRLFLLLIVVLLARLLGLWALFYVTGFLLLISLLSIASLYATDIKHILETNFAKLIHHHAAHPVSTADWQHMIKALSEALSVLVRSHQSALIIIKKDKPLTRLAENGTKMNSIIKPELIIDFFSSGSNLSKGAVIIEGNKIIAAGSTLWQPNAKILFNTNNPAITRAANDLRAVVIVVNRTIGDINLLTGEDSYKNLSPRDLARLLQNILIYNQKN